MKVAQFISRDNLLRPNLQNAHKRSVSYHARRGLLPSLKIGGSGYDLLDTNETLRRCLIRLIDFGINQKSLAKKLGLHPSWFSRWVNQKGSPAQALSVRELDAFVALIDAWNALGVDLKRELETMVQQRTATPPQQAAPLHREPARRKARQRRR
jgi:hypothetical protein